MEKQITTAVIGAGPSGVQTALSLSAAGHKVYLIDKQIGGNYTKSGSAVSNTLLYISYLYNSYKIQSVNFINQEIKSALAFDFSKVKKHVEQVSSKIIKKFVEDIKETDIEFLTGLAEFTSPDSLIVKVVNEEGKEYCAKEIRFDYCVIASGSTGKDCGFPNCNKLLNISSILNLNEVPASVAIIGGGFVGTELTAFFKRIGSEVTVIEKGENLLGSFDSQVAKRYEDNCKKNGINIIKNAQVEKVEKIGNKHILFMKEGGKIESEEVFVAVGRVPHVKTLNLSAAGVILEENNKPKLTKSLKSSNPNIYFVGDATGAGMLVNWAYRSSEIAVNAILETGKRFKRNVLPRVLYVDPELAFVGLSEDEAKTAGLDYSVIKYTYSDLEKSMIMGAAKGFLKIVYNNEDRKIIGCHVIGKGAAQIVNTFSILIQSNIKIDKIEDYILNHPAFSEILSDIASKIK